MVHVWACNPPYMYRWTCLLVLHTKNPSMVPPQINQLWRGKRWQPFETSLARILWPPWTSFYSMVAIIHELYIKGEFVAERAMLFHSSLMPRCMQIEFDYISHHDQAVRHPSQYLGQANGQPISDMLQLNKTLYLWPCSWSLQTSNT